MKFVITNDFSEQNVGNGSLYSVRPFDYDKFRNGRIVEFDTEEELIAFINEASETIRFAKDSSYEWDYIDVCIRYTNYYDDEGLKLRIMITHESIS